MAQEEDGSLNFDLSQALKWYKEDSPVKERTNLLQGPTAAKRSTESRKQDIAETADQQQLVLDFKPAPRPSAPGRSAAPKVGPFTTHTVRNTVRIRLTHGPQNEAVLAHLTQVLADPQTFEAMMRRVVANAYLPRIVGRFTANVEKALEMKTTIQNNQQVKFSPQLRMRDQKNKQRLARTLAAINDAQLKGNRVAADKLRGRADRIATMIENSLSYRRNGKERIDPHPLSVARGVGQFRKSLYALLSLLADIMTSTVYRTSFGVGVLIGKLSILEQIKTPSATFALTGAASRSNYQTFWRHVEFGTGLYRKSSTLNQPASAKAEWWYGPKGSRRGVMVSGSHPMNFLTNKSGQIYQSDVDALATAIGVEMTKMFSLNK